MRVSTIVEKYIRVSKNNRLERCTYLYCQQRTHLIYICILHNVPEVNIFTSCTWDNLHVPYTGGTCAPVHVTKPDPVTCGTHTPVLPVQVGLIDWCTSHTIGPYFTSTLHFHCRSLDRNSPTQENLGKTESCSCPGNPPCTHQESPTGAAQHQD